MNPHWAEENLLTIRTLMERSTLYRRTLAPIMLFAGGLGCLTAGAGLWFHLESTRPFVLLWFSTAALAVIGTFLIARRQAFHEKESFWSPPTRRVAQALLPPLFAGLALSLALAVIGLNDPGLLAFVWLFFYGCALHAAGFFMPRGMKIFGWVFIGLAALILAVLVLRPPTVPISAHWVMGFFFGFLHLAYGVYLYLTEKEKHAA